MPFLSLNGLTIPVAAEQMSGAYDEVARVTRQATGQLSRDARIAKRRWDITTRPIKWDDAQLLLSMLYGPVWAWNFSTGAIVGGLPVTAIASSYTQDLLYSSRTAADGVVVENAARYGAYAFQPAYSNTNLWAQLAGGNVTSGTDAGTETGFASDGSATIQSSTAARWQGTRALSVTAAAGAVRGFTVSPMTVSIGPRYFASFYVRGDVAASNWTAELVSNGSVVKTLAFQAVPTAWRRICLHGVATATSNFILRVRTSAGGVAFFDGFQLESGARSPWHASARTTVTNATYVFSKNVLGSAAGMTLSIWVAPSDTFDAVAFSAWDTAGNWRLSLRQNAYSGLGEPLKWTLVDNNTNTTRTVTTSSFTWPQYQGWTHVACIVRPAPYTPQLAIYINGVLHNSTSPGITFLPSNIDRIFLGNDNGVYQYNAPLSNPVVFPYALTGDAIKALTSAGATSAIAGDWPLMRASGDFLPGGGSVYVFATVTGSTVMQGALPTGGFGNYQQLTLSLLEN